MIGDDLNAFLSTFGDACSVAGVTFTGIFDQPDQELSMGGVHVQSTNYELMVKTSDALSNGIKKGTVIVRYGVNFSVREVIAQDDGAFSNIMMSKI